MEPDTATVRFVNLTGVDIFFRFVGSDPNASLTVSCLPKGKSYKRNVLTGRRVLVAWEDGTDDIVSIIDVNVNMSGKLRITRSPFTMSGSAIELDDGTDRLAAIGQ